MRKGLSTTQQALLAKRLRGAFPGSGWMRTIPKRAEAASYPLSFAQQRLWFLSQLEPASSAYHMPSAWRLQGPLNVPALERGLTDLASRHETLRTGIRVEAEQPRQYLSAAAPVAVPVRNLEPLPAAEREGAARGLLDREMRRPFDLQRPPLWRVLLIRLDAVQHILLLDLHHIICDGWSLEVLRRELTTLYRTHAEGGSFPLEELPIQYADFAVWQREWLGDERLRAPLRYWRQHLAGVPPALELPTDRRPAGLPQSAAGECGLRLRPPLTDGLRSLSHEQGVSLFTTVLAVFQILLHRLSGQTDLVVGSPVAARNWRETEGLIGLFLNNLVLRSRFSANHGFDEFLRSTRACVLEALEHQHLPFEKDF